MSGGGASTPHGSLSETAAQTAQEVLRACVPACVPGEGAGRWPVAPISCCAQSAGALLQNPRLRATSPPQPAGVLAAPSHAGADRKRCSLQTCLAPPPPPRLPDAQLGPAVCSVGRTPRSQLFIRSGVRLDAHFKVSGPPRTWGLVARGPGDVLGSGCRDGEGRPGPPAVVGRALERACAPGDCGLDPGSPSSSLDMLIPGCRSLMYITGTKEPSPQVLVSVSDMRCVYVVS